MEVVRHVDFEGTACHHGAALTICKKAAMIPLQAAVCNGLSDGQEYVPLQGSTKEEEDKDA